MTDPLRDEFPAAARSAGAQVAGTPTRILDAAAAVLQADGIAGLRIEAVARRCGLPPQTVRRYFPHTRMLLAELTRRMVDQWYDIGAAVGAPFEPGTPWRVQWEALVRYSFATVRATVGARAVLTAILDDPACAAIAQAGNRRFISVVALALARLQPALAPAVAGTAATLLNRSLVAILHETIADNDEDAAPTLDALIAMHRRLLEDLLEPLPQPQSVAQPQSVPAQSAR